MKNISSALRLAPFTVYVVLFFVVPTGIVVANGFQNSQGQWTIDSFNVFNRPGVSAAFFNSLWISLVTSLLGAILGVVVCYALLGCKPNGIIRKMVDAASSTLSQFGGVMLAFAFIATMGNQGLITVLLRELAHIDIYAKSMWLYTPVGLLLPYLFFQIPLMIITFYPAVARLPQQYAQAVASIGGSKRVFWWNVGLPILFPSFMGGFLLLFANAFSAYATAAALISQGSQIAPLQVRSLLNSETGLGSQNASAALAVGMLGIMTIIVLLYALIERKASAWLG